MTLRNYLSLFGLLCLTALVGGCRHASPALGSKKFTESYVLADIAKIQLEKDGLSYQHREGMGGTIILWQALKKGDIQFYPEYTGTISEEILKQGAMTPDTMRTALAKQGMSITGNLGFNDTYALVMRRDKAAKLGIKTIGDLRAHPDLRVGLTPEFLGRKDGWKPLSARYDLHIATVRSIEHGLGYAALVSDQIDLKDAYSTDAKIAEDDLVTLTDDLNFFPQYQAVFLYRLDADSRAITALRKLEGKISATRMTELNSLAEKTKNYGLAAASFYGAEDQKRAAASEETLSSKILRLTKEHLELVIVSMLAAILIGIPLGILASRGGLIGHLVLNTVGVIQTIPSLALLALFIPLFGADSTTAIVALFLYSLLPIVRNTAVGLQDIGVPIRESAAALGLEPGAQLLKVYLPMASRTILAGIKTSAIINVGTATLAGLIGAGGYGEPIQSGLQLNDNATIMQGAIPAAVLAILVQIGFDLLDRLLIPRGLQKLGSRG